MVDSNDSVWAIKSDELDDSSISSQNMRTNLDHNFDKKDKLHLPDLEGAIAYWKNFNDSSVYDIEVWCTSWGMLSRK